MEKNVNTVNLLYAAVLWVRCECFEFITWLKKHMMGQNVRGRKERKEERRKDINDDEEEQII